MGMFGGSGASSTTNTTTTVSPSEDVANILQNVVAYTEGIDPGHYITKQHAGFNQYEQDALNRMANSDPLNYMSGITKGFAQTGASIENALGRALESVLAGGGQITPDVLKGQSKILLDSMKKAESSASPMVAQASSTLGGTPESNATASMALGNASASALPKLEQASANLAYSMLTGDQKAGARGLKQAGELANTYMKEGGKGAKAGNQAIQNELKAGQIAQKEQQAEYNTAWENAMGQQLFPYEYVNNLANVLNKVDRYAGYTTHSTRKTQMPSTSFFSPVNIGKRMKTAGKIAMTVAAFM